MADLRIVKDGVIIGVATGVFGAGFGVLSTTSGLTVAQTLAMSLLVFTGASQFAAVSVIGAGGSPATAVGSALMLAARNSFYGMTMSSLIRGSWAKRAVAAQLTIDESTALASAQDGPEDAATGFWSAGLAVFVFWNLGTLLGSLGGSAIGEPETLGLDAAFPAGFIALMMPSLRHRAGRVAAATGAAIAALTVAWAPAGVPIILSALGAVLALVVCGPHAVPPARSAASDAGAS